jgi:hypothetical protein
MAELDHCGSCGSARLIARLGEVECRDCGWVRAAVPAAGDVTTTSEVVGRGTADLAEEVAQALSRVLGKSASRPRR